MNGYQIVSETLNTKTIGDVGGRYLGNLSYGMARPSLINRMSRSGNRGSTFKELVTAAKSQKEMVKMLTDRAAAKKLAGDLKGAAYDLDLVPYHKKRFLEYLEKARRSQMTGQDQW